jgi:AcrR family transcriptional regulator
MRVKSNTVREVEAHIKNERLIKERRNQIIKGAMQVFSHKGFHDATVREIADAAGLTMGTMYNYVRTKEDILYIVYDHMTNILTSSMQEAMAGIDDPQQQLRAALRKNMDLIHEYEDIIMFLYTESSSHTRESLHTVLAQESRYVEVFQDLLKRSLEGQGKKVNEFQLKLTADILAYMPVILALRRWSLQRRFASMEDVKEGILDFLKKGIGIIEE